MLLLFLGAGSRSIAAADPERRHAAPQLTWTSSVVANAQIDRKEALLEAQIRRISRSPVGRLASFFDDAARGHHLLRTGMTPSSSIPPSRSR
jgi:hypothetical protein